MVAHWFIPSMAHPGFHFVGINFKVEFKPVIAYDISKINAHFR